MIVDIAPLVSFKTCCAPCERNVTAGDLSEQQVGLLFRLLASSARSIGIFLLYSEIYDML